MSDVIHIDFETRSAVDLRKVGADVYSNHPSTEVLCVGFAQGDSPPTVVPPGNIGVDFKAASYIAHNAAFEIAIWNNVCVPKYGWRPVSPSQFTCTMVRAYAMGLPGNLDDASAAVGIKDGKDQAGKRIMMQLSRPKKVHADGTVQWWEHDKHADKYEKLYAYCEQDVALERELYRRLRALNDYERRVWLLDQKINDRGIGIDVGAAKIAYEIIEIEKKRLNDLMAALTDGFVSTCNSNIQLVRWLNSRGQDIESVDKATVAALLEKLPPSEVRSVLLLRQQAAKSSTAKLKAMILRAGSGNRIRGSLQYHGAATGRWAGRGFQTQNLPRPNISQDDIQWIMNTLKT